MSTKGSPVFKFSLPGGVTCLPVSYATGYIPKHLGKYSSKPTKLKIQFFYG